MVGSLSTEKESLYGQIFARYLADPKNLFIISSDFCHWGQRFRYTFYERSWGEIHQSIKTLDHKVKYIFSFKLNVLVYIYILLYYDIKQK